MNGPVELLNPQPRDVNRMLPDMTPMGTGCAYVVQYDTGWIKVGYATKVKGRIAQHVNPHPLVPLKATRVWVSAPMPRYRDVERALLAYAEDTCTERAKSEYFLGCDFAELAAVAQQPLPPPAPTPDLYAAPRPRKTPKPPKTPATATVSQRIAAHLLDEPIETWIRARRPHTPWRALAAELSVATDGALKVTHETLRAWAPDPPKPPPLPLPRRAAS